MPFKSQAQRRFMYAEHPSIAKEFQSHMPKLGALPEHVSPMENEEKPEAYPHLKNFLMRMKKPPAY